MNPVVIFETLHRHLRSIPYLLYIAIVSIIASFAGALGGPANVWQSFATLLVIILGCQLIGPEFSSGTLQLVLAKPLNRASYLVSRVIGVVFAIWLAAIVPFLFDLGGRLLIDKSPNTDVARLFAGLANLCVDALLVCALFALFGSMTRSYLNVAIYFLLRIGLGMIIGSITAIMSGAFDSIPRATQYLRDHPGVLEVVRTIEKNLFPQMPSAFDRNWIMMVVTNAAVALLLAVLIFRRREVPYGAD